LAKQKIATLGKLLLIWGYNPALLGLNRAGIRLVGEQLAAAPGVEPGWLDEAPWRVWQPAHVWNGITWCLILAVVGARLYHVLTPSPSMAARGIVTPLDYFRHPFELINLRAGGLGIYGGIAGGALGLYVYARRYRLPALAWADLAAVGLALGQAVGRWGNFFNQELYGKPAELPWAITIEPAHRLPAFADVARFHPAFLYESIWNFLAFIVLYTLARRYRDRLQSGDLVAVYLILYAVGRSLLETVRLDSRAVSLGLLELTLPVATLVSLAIALVMGLWLAFRHLRPGNKGTL
jgi:phosphatidylglycerol:prolipoprotein diacylglycerol transferase